MCANCGCGIPDDNHGDDRNINWSAIVTSAEANDISPAEAVQNLQKMAEQQGEFPQPRLAELTEATCVTWSRVDRSSRRRC
jgi:hypothetical protein